MNRVKWERFKLYVLITLILTSVLQVGILWNSQNHGFPYYFFSDLLSKKESFDPSVKYGFFSPYRIIVSEGIDAAHWIIGKNDKYYNILYNEASTYILDILSDHIKSNQVLPLTGGELGKLVVKPSVSVEFKADISRELLAFFLDIKDFSSSEFSSVKKIIILPDSDLCTIAIVDDVSKKIFEYTLPYQKPEMGRKYYEDLIKDLSMNENLINYGVIKELQIPKENFKGIRISEDIPYVARRTSKYGTYSTISCLPPEEFQFEIKNSQNAEDLMPLADTILQNEKDNYIPSTDIYGAAVFKNVGSVYRVYKDGLLEYNYSSSSQDEIEKGSVSDAFVRALTFINNKEKLIKGATVFLSGVDDTIKDRYRFTFDYNMDEVPVFFNYQVNDKEKTFLKNAITIEATGDRILNCWWIFKDFKKENEYNYDVYFMDLLHNLYREKDIPMNTKNLDIKNIGVCYKVTEKDFKNDIDPAWLIELVDSETYTVKMEKK